MIYEKLRESLIEKGADPKLFDMPAIRERLEQETISPDDIVINSDGTFNFGRYIIEKKKMEQVEILTIVEYYEATRYKNAALDAPFSLDEDYEPTYKELAAKLTLVNSDGIEVETQEIDNDILVERYLDNGLLSAKTFEEKSDLVSKRIVRDEGLIRKYEGTDREHIFYDLGAWNLDDSYRYSWGTREGDQPSRVIAMFDAKTRSFINKYPHLQEYTENKREELMNRIDERTSSLISENLNLKSNNEKLQKMLNKSLTFAQTVRDSRVGKIFFGKKAKELLGDQDNDTKQLPR